MTTSAISDGQLHLAGPSVPLDAAHWPVRGDLAHINLAGKVFVPHYAVPMPHRVAAAGAALRAANQPDADLRDQLNGGTVFNVLDMAGGWAWGQVGEDGFVGYVPLDELEAA
ncbi:SH3 domain-containing protein [Novosphingobium sp.]|uniref:SH3 domain-containing protein n=1 Tax=Novosphingobium sp. TaxID=1874826 RepID=UPI0027371943|nr:SH3 domain-containing protein [Novosphingobium sp.]MDP3908107.1 SH3 domain-containing protein [Novosphingobium sp.]